MLHCHCGASMPSFSALCAHVAKCKRRADNGDGGSDAFTFSIASEDKKPRRVGCFVVNWIADLLPPKPQSRVEPRPKRMRKGPAETKRENESLLRQNRDVPGLLVESFDALRGRIVVANRPIAKGDFVAEYTGQLISRKEGMEREERYKRRAGSFLMFFTFDSKRSCMDATVDDGRLGRLISHGKRLCNVKPVLLPIDNKPRIIFVATRDIARGEELFYDYGENRREIIESFPWLER